MASPPAASQAATLAAAASAFGKIVDRDRRPFRRKRLGNGSADAPAGARYQDGFPGEIHWIIPESSLS